MEAIKTKGRAKDGVLTVPVPEEFEGRDLEVIILSGEETLNGEAKDEMAQRQKLNRLLSVTGTAKDFNKTFDKHEVYDQ